MTGDGDEALTIHTHEKITLQKYISFLSWPGGSVGA